MAVVTEPRINATGHRVTPVSSPDLLSPLSSLAVKQGRVRKASLKEPASEAEFDDALVVRARRGDRVAQAELVRSLQDVWFRFCVGRLRSPEDARDAAQETALRFLKGLAGARGGSTVRTWSLGIALNVCREMCRKHDGEHVDLAAVAEPMADGESLDAEFDRWERSLRLHELLETLTGRQREVVLLRFFEGLSVTETATAMGCAEGTVKAMLSQALTALRSRWESKP